MHKLHRAIPDLPVHIAMDDPKRKKIDNLEHAILKIDDYIKYSSHTIDTVYIYALNRLIEQYIKDEKYEVADLVKKGLQLVQANVLKEMKRRMEEAEKTL